MAARNTEVNYGSVAKFFHWLIASLVVIMLIIGVSLSYISPSAKGTVITLHKSIGLTVLTLMVLRLLWRILNVIPQLPTTVPQWQVIAARINHWLLYAVVILMPISGFLMSSFGGHATNVWWLFSIKLPVAKDSQLSQLFSTIHTYLAWTIMILLVIHTLAALKHHFVNKDFVLKRMLPGQRIE